jgi:hypothetical protein
VAYRMRVFGHDHSGLTPGMSDQDKSMPGMSRQEGSPREMEAARIAAQNMVMLDKLKNTITDTYDTICEDNAADVTTLDAQAATASKAGERAQKDAEAVRIAAPNKAFRGKLKNTKEVTNSDITNGVAAHGTSVGAGRAKAAASSKARKDAEAQELANANAALAARLALARSATDDGDGRLATDLKSLAIAALPPLKPSSSTTTATFSRFRAAEAAREQVQECRARRESREVLKAQQAEEWAAQGRERVESARGRRERIHGLEVAMLSERTEIVREQKEAASRREETRVMHRRLFAAQVGVLVAEARSLDLRLDASEARAKQVACEEGTRTREAILHEVAQAKQQQLGWCRLTIEAVKAARSAILEARRSANEDARASVDTTREAARARAAERLIRDQEYLTRARENKRRALSFRARARQSKADVVAQRRASARSERSNDHLVAETKARVLRSNRKNVAEIYEHRFVSKHEQRQWEASSLRRLHQQASARGGLTSIRGSARATALNALDERGVSRV